MNCIRCWLEWHLLNPRTVVYNGTSLCFESARDVVGGHLQEEMNKDAELEAQAKRKLAGS